MYRRNGETALLRCVNQLNESAGAIVADLGEARLWFGAAAGVLFIVGIVLIGLALPGYSHVTQTVSELGELGSPARWPFALLLCSIAVCLVIFAAAAREKLRSISQTAAPAYLVASMAVSVAGVGIFAFPNPWHNVFGMSELIGYQAPLAAALSAWRKDSLRRISRFSAIMYIAVLVALALNLAAIGRNSAFWQLIKPEYGLIQRLLFVVWFAWCAGFAVMLLRVTQAVSSRVTTR